MMSWLSQCKLRGGERGSGFFFFPLNRKIRLLFILRGINEGCCTEMFLIAPRDY